MLFKMTRIKYPRIPHIIGSHPGRDDILLDKSIFNNCWIVTEKVDGSQICILVDNGIIRAFNRNTELLLGNSDHQFDELQLWINFNYEAIISFLDNNYTMYGEWMYHQHTVYYNQLSDWFIGFGIKDRRSNEFINTYEARRIFHKMRLSVVPILYEGSVKDIHHLQSLITTSAYSFEDMEGIVLHSLDGQTRCKYVTKAFQDAVDNSRHWRSCDRIKNIKR